MVCRSTGSTNSEPDGGAECDTQVPLERALPACVNTAGCRNKIILKSKKLWQEKYNRLNECHHWDKVLLPWGGKACKGGSQKGSFKLFHKHFPVQPFSLGLLGMWSTKYKYFSVYCQTILQNDCTNLYLPVRGYEFLQFLHILSASGITSFLTFANLIRLILLTFSFACLLQK